MKCPYCHHELTAEQVRALWGTHRVSLRKTARGAKKVRTRCGKCNTLCDSAREARGHCRAAAAETTSNMKKGKRR